MQSAISPFSILDHILRFARPFARIWLGSGMSRCRGDALRNGVSSFWGASVALSALVASLKQIAGSVGALALRCLIVNPSSMNLIALAGDVKSSGGVL
jgi:hypothetical protein